MDVLSSTRKAAPHVLWVRLRPLLFVPQYNLTFPSSVFRLTIIQADVPLGRAVPLYDCELTLVQWTTLNGQSIYSRKLFLVKQYLMLIIFH